MAAADKWSEKISVSVIVHKKPIAKIDSSVPALVLEHKKVYFSGEGIDDNDVVRFLWISSLDGVIFNGTKNDFSTNNLSRGNHVITLKVQDSNGAWSEEAVQIIEVHIKPTANIILVSSDLAIEGDTIRLVASGFDDGTIARFLWISSIDGVLYNGTEPEVEFNNLSVGTHTLTLQVQDNHGIWSEEMLATLQVKEGKRGHTATVMFLAALAGVFLTLLFTISYWYPLFEKKK